MDLFYSAVCVYFCLLDPAVAEERPGGQKRDGNGNGQSLCSVI